jgi:hypothetical protein
MWRWLLNINANPNLDFLQNPIPNPIEFLSNVDFFM